MTEAARPSGEAMEELPFLQSGEIFGDEVCDGRRRVAYVK
jgi:hypothetical protein